MDPANLFPNNEGESNNLNWESYNFEEDNQGELEDNFCSLQFWSGLGKLYSFHEIKIFVMALYYFILSDMIFVSQS